MPPALHPLQLMMLQAFALHLLEEIHRQEAEVAKANDDYDASGNGTMVLTNAVKYLYDGWNCIAEMNAMPTTATVVRTYAWGRDLGGALHGMGGSGGIGGLLMGNLNDGNSTTQMTYYGYDGNGNVITLANASGNIVANYDYDPFGNVVRMNGAWAVFNPVRFSTKYSIHNATYAGRDTGLIYYDERILKDGRFLNRDPIGEAGGVNLYGVCGNDLINRYDYLGEDSGQAAREGNLPGAPAVPGSRPAPYNGTGEPQIGSAAGGAKAAASVLGMAGDALRSYLVGKMYDRLAALVAEALAACKASQIGKGGTECQGCCIISYLEHFEPELVSSGQFVQTLTEVNDVRFEYFPVPCSKRGHGQFVGDFRLGDEMKDELHDVTWLNGGISMSGFRFTYRYPSD